MAKSSGPLSLQLYFKIPIFLVIIFHDFILFIPLIFSRPAILWDFLHAFNCGAEVFNPFTDCHTFTDWLLCSISLTPLLLPVVEVIIQFHFESYYVFNQIKMEGKRCKLQRYTYHWDLYLTECLKFGFRLCRGGGLERSLRLAVQIN